MNASITAGISVLMGLAMAVLRKPFAQVSWVFQKLLPAKRPPLWSVEVGVLCGAACLIGFGAWTYVREVASPVMAEFLFILIGVCVALASRTLGRVAWRIDRSLGVTSSNAQQLTSGYRAAGIVAAVFGAVVSIVERWG